MTPQKGQTSKKYKLTDEKVNDILRLMSCIFFGIGGSSVLIRKLKPNLNIASPFNFLMASVVTGVISLVLFVVWDYIAFGLAEKLMNKNVK